MRSRNWIIDSSDDKNSEVETIRHNLETKLTQLLSVLGLNQSTFKSISEGKKWLMKKLSNVSAAKRARAVCIAKAVIIEIYKIMWLNDPDRLFRAIRKENKEIELVENIQAIASVLPSSTVQSDMLLALIVKTHNTLMLWNKFSIRKWK